jgi:TPR repeat protein
MKAKTVLFLTFYLIFSMPCVLASEYEEQHLIWKEVQAKAEGGDPKFQTQVGEAFIYGRGIVVPQEKIDLELGWKWLRLAAMKGHKPGQKAYAASKLRHYLMNRGTDREELLEALMWYCMHEGRLIDFSKDGVSAPLYGGTSVSEGTCALAHEKTRAFWLKHPELKK